MNVVQSGVDAVAAGLLQAVARRRRRALAHDVERHALAHLALRRAVGEERHLGVRVEVDEAGRDDEARSRRSCAARCGREIADGDDAVAPDADIGADGRRRPCRRAPAHCESGRRTRRLTCDGDDKPQTRDR